MNTGIIARMTKRQYSRDFTPRTDRRIKLEIDRVPPKLEERLRTKMRQNGNISLRWLTLTLWRMWTDGEIQLPGDGFRPTE